MANGRVDPGHNNGVSVVHALAKEKVKKRALMTVFKHSSVPIGGVGSLLNGELGNSVKFPQCLSASHELPSTSGVRDLRHELKEGRMLLAKAFGETRARLSEEMMTFHLSENELDIGGTFGVDRFCEHR